MKTKILMLGFIAILFASCKEKDTNQPNSGNSVFQPTILEIKGENGNSIVCEYDSLYRIIKYTENSISDTSEVSMYNVYSYTDDAFYITEYNSSNVIVNRDTFHLVSGRIISFEAGDSIIYNAEGYIEKKIIANGAIREALYEGGNLKSETYTTNEGEKDLPTQYEYYTDKEDKYRLTSLIFSNYYMINRYQLYTPVTGKASKNLLKKYTTTENLIYNISYDFDVNGYPSKLKFQSADESGSIEVNFK